MYGKALTIALAGLTLATTGAANAAQFSYGVDTMGSSQVMTYPAVISGTTAAAPCATTCGAGYSALGCEPLFGKYTHYDTNRGYGYRNDGLLGFGGPRYGTTRVNEFAAVLADECGRTPATEICGQQLSNSLFDIRLFGFGLGFGKVAPRLDMRPAGHAW